MGWHYTWTGRNPAGFYVLDYTDPRTGKRNRKSLKTKNKSEAKARAEALMAQVEGEARAARVLRLKDYAAGFFNAGGKWYTRRLAMSKPVKPYTLTRWQNWLTRLYLPAFGDEPVASITSAMVQDWALGLKYDGSTKNEILRVFKIIIDEALRDRARPDTITLERFARTKSSRRAMSTKEIHTLWPYPFDIEQLVEIWRNKDSNHKPKARECLAYAGIYGLMMSTGLRPGEARALEVDHIDLGRGVVYIMQAFNGEDHLDHLKKGTADDPKRRVTVMAAQTVELLQLYESVADPGRRFYFEPDGEHIKRWGIGRRLGRAINNNGLDPEGLTPHSLRYTYISRIRGQLGDDVMRTMVGHASEQMTDHYDRPVLEDRATQLLRQGIAEAAGSVWV